MILYDPKELAKVRPISQQILLLKLLKPRKRSFSQYLNILPFHNSNHTKTKRVTNKLLLYKYILSQKFSCIQTYPAPEILVLKKDPI